MTQLDWVGHEPVTFRGKRLIVYVRRFNNMKTEQAIEWLDRNIPEGWRSR